ncbi:ATP-dependent nuclease subunit B [Fictibacillus macauensis ZFHKF-1]|uniref:ATP-dependent helicase/deoxyribonuclease subunit B n=1 Tax=Fictibacillus macauensis ZFHKF-1 TaxID=1196324 RepID=I8UCA6_9BACL|nr:helicase-exonuclease AddAB subunit AddB [Fictibacillus macauensis]EIT84535.1 ATP-dependent nuclease subunit B [Fictibacillus macauensis ZFHKF-1]
MSLRLIVGRAGSGKSHYIQEEIANALRETQEGPPILYIVPDQMTFQSEYELINKDHLHGMMRAQVFSFSRLAWKVLSETGGMNRIHLSSVGMSMMLRKIIEHKKHELLVFKKASEQPGFYEQIERMMTEFKRYCVDAQALKWNVETLLTYSGEDAGIIKGKLHDLALIANELEKATLQQYIDSEDYLKLLVEKIPYSTYVAHAEFYIDGFHHLAPGELEVIRMLMKYAKRVTVALTLESLSAAAPHELDIFYTPKKTALNIRKLAQEEAIMEEETVVLENRPRFVHNQAISHIEDQFDQRPAVIHNDSHGITIHAAVNRRTEVDRTAREIVRLVREEGYRYHEMALSIRNMNDYQHLLETIFEEYEIPIFLDQKKSMLHHPFIELIRSSLEAVGNHWRYESVFRAVKTGLLYPPDMDWTEEECRHQMDVLENYVLAYGIKGNRWVDSEPWKVQRYQVLEEPGVRQTDEERLQQRQLNEAREMIAAPLHRLMKDMKKAHTVRDYCEYLFLFLERLQLPLKLEKLSNQSQAEGRLRKAREHSQVWDAMIGLLDEMVEVAGDEHMSYDLWVKMLDTGLEAMKFALVPPALDQVLAGTMDRSRYTGVKCQFILGVNEGILPAKPEGDGLLSEEERTVLSQNGLSLAPDANRKLLDEQFLIYVALSNASDRLYVSYPLADEEGKNLLPSMVINRLTSLFTELPIFFETQDPEAQSALSYIATPLKSISFLNTQLREWKKGYGMDPIWWDVYNWSTHHGKWRIHGQRVLQSLFYFNQEKKLSKQTATNLYGSKISASVSRMELHQACPFSQFLSYGLKLKERRLYRLEAPDIGQLFHAALKNMDEYLGQHNLQWQGLTQKDCYRLAGDVVDQLSLSLQRQILLSSKRHLYIKSKLRDIVGRASHILSEHARASGFSPIGLELGFGHNESLPPLVFTLPNGTTMEIVGRIDRVDSAEGKELLLRIIDYKSSATGLQMDEVYYGLALQMLTYLDVVLSHAQKWLGREAVPGGVLYFHIHNPMLDHKQLLTVEEIQTELFKKFKMKGLVLAETEAVQLMDQTFEKKSNIVPVTLTNKGFHRTQSSVATASDFKTLTGHVRKVIQQVGTEMTEGVIDISPYELKSKTPCTFCSYRTICQFDQSLEENEYRTLKKESDAVMLEKMREEE